MIKQLNGTWEEKGDLGSNLSADDFDVEDDLDDLGNPVGSKDKKKASN